MAQIFAVMRQDKEAIDTTTEAIQTSLSLQQQQMMETQALEKQHLQAQVLQQQQLHVQQQELSQAHVHAASPGAAGQVQQVEVAAQQTAITQSQTE